MCRADDYKTMIRQEDPRALTPVVPSNREDSSRRSERRLPATPVKTYARELPGPYNPDLPEGKRQPPEVTGTKFNMWKACRKCGYEGHLGQKCRQTHSKWDVSQEKNWLLDQISTGALTHE